MDVLSARVLIDHEDFDGAVRWWTEVLGLEIYREFGAGGEVTGVVLFTGGGFVELSGSGVPARELRHGYLLWLQVPDARATVDRLAAAGTTVDEPASRKPWGLVEARIRDPEGVGIVIVEVPPEHPIRRRVH